MVLLERAVCPSWLPSARLAHHIPLFYVCFVPRQTVRPNWRGVANPRAAQSYPAAGRPYAVAAYPSAGVPEKLTGVRSTA
jgi:hypothetical protein